MTDGSSHFNLGLAPATGADGVTQCNIFKQMLWHQIGRNHDGAWLDTYVEGGKRGVSVRYHPAIAGAYEWALDAKQYAREIWQEVEHGITCKVRGR